MGAGSKIRAGMAFIEIGVVDKTKKILKKIGKRMQALGASMARIGKKAAMMGAAILAAFVVPIKAAASMQEVMSKFEVVFGAATDSVEKFGIALANRLGRSKKQMLEFLAGAQDLLVPLGLSVPVATNMSKAIAELAVDLASFNEKTDEMAFNDLQSALTGSGEVMKKYGVVLNETTVKQELFNMGIDPKNATNAQKVLARYAVIVRGVSNAQGDATETAGSFSNQIKRMRGLFSDAMVEMGNAVLPVATKLVNMLNSVLTIVGQLSKDFPGATKAVAGLGGILAVVGGLLASIGIGVPAITVGLGLLKAAFLGIVGVVVSATTALASFVAGLSLPVQAMAALTAAFLTFTSAGNSVVSWFTDTFGALADLVSTTMGGIMAAISAGDWALAFEFLWAAVDVVWQNSLLKMRQAFNATMENIFGRTIITWFNRFVSLISAAFEAAAMLISAFVDKAVRLLKGLASVIKTVVGFALDVTHALLEFTGILPGLRMIVNLFVKLVKTIADLVMKIPGMKALFEWFTGTMSWAEKDEMAEALHRRAKAADAASAKLAKMRRDQIKGEEKEKEAAAARAKVEAELALQQAEKEAAEAAAVAKAAADKEKAAEDAAAAEKEHNREMDEGRDRQREKQQEAHDRKWDLIKKEKEEELREQKRIDEKIIEERKRRDELIAEQQAKHAEFVASEAARRTSTATFSAAAVGRLGQQGIMMPAKETAANTKQIARSNQRIADLLQKQAPVGFR